MKLYIHLIILTIAACLTALSIFCSPSPSSNNPSFTPADTTDKYAATRVQCVDKINSLRATIGLGPLVYRTQKDSCTDRQARQDSESGVAHGAFGQCGEQAQNECPGYGSQSSIVNGCLVSMWNEGPGQPYSQHGHYINMTNTAYTKVSVGFYTTPSGSVWAVFNFYP
jgi:hypothetical protein